MSIHYDETELKPQELNEAILPDNGLIYSPLQFPCIHPGETPFDPLGLTDLIPMGIQATEASCISKVTHEFSNDYTNYINAGSCYEKKEDWKTPLRYS